MVHRRLRASAFVFSTRRDARLRTDGIVAGRTAATDASLEVERAARHAFDSARLEGVTLEPEFVRAVIDETLAGGPATRREH